MSFTDLDFVLDSKTGEHLTPARIKNRDGAVMLLTPADMEAGSPSAPLPDMQGLVAHLWAVRMAPEQPDDASVVWHGVPLRVTFLACPGALSVSISRALWPLPDLTGLGYPSDFIARLRRAMAAPGLVLFIGDMGAGKTTTMTSAVVDHVTRTSCKGLILEDMNELPIAGLYGDAGLLLQSAVAGGDYAPHIAHAMRTRVQTLVVNEVRSATTARETLLAAGRVSLLTTCQGHTIAQGLAVIRDLAAGQGGAAWAATALAASLSAVVRVQGTGTRMDGTRGMLVEALFVDGEYADAIRSTIRNDGLHLLRDHIRRCTPPQWQGFTGTRRVA